jgi:ATP-binding cassette subfamily B multidrug efflux pump
MIGGPRGLLEQETSKPRSVGRTLGRLLHYFEPFWLALVGVLLLMIVNAWVQVVTPELFGQAVDCYLTPATVGATTAAIDADMTAQGEQPPAQAPTGEPPANDALSCWFGAVPAGSPTVDYVAGLGRLVLGLVVIYVVGAITGGLMFYLMGWAGQHVLRSIQVDVFAHLHKLSLGYYSRHESGDLMSRITNDTSTLQQAISFALVQVLSGALLLVWFAWTMLMLNWAYALISLAVVPVMAVATSLVQRPGAARVPRHAQGDRQRQRRAGGEHLRRARGAGLQPRGGQHRGVPHQQRRQPRRQRRAVAFTSALAPTLEALGYVAIAIVAGVGGIFMLQGHDAGRHGGDAGADHRLHRLCAAFQPADRPDCRALGQHPERRRRRRAHLRPARRAAGDRGEVRRPARCRPSSATSSSSKCAPNTSRASRCSRGSTWWPNRARPSPSSGRRARARRRWSTCCPASTT